VEAKGKTNPSQGGSGVFSDGALAGNSTFKVRADFEGLLALAESLQQSLEQHSDTHRRLRLSLQGSLLAAYAGFAAGVSLIMSGVEAHDYVSRSHLLPPLVFIVLGVACLLLVPLAGYHVYSQRRYFDHVRRALREDRRDLTEVVELLREIEPIIAKEENLSALERVQIRIRLSRFGVGPSSRNGAAAIAEEPGADFHARKSRVDQELAKPL